jgi:predicted Zn-dependent protease
MFEPSDSMDGFPPRIIDPTMRPVPPSAIESVDAEACNSWTESGVRSPTVSVARLAIPGKASSEFQKGCSAYKDKRYPLAEDHLRAAIAEYADYAAAWVVLGQTLDGEHKRDDARKACSQASTLDPKYVAPYLCLAEFAATDDDWKQVSELSKQALAIDPVNNPYSLYYSASADLHFQNLADAETSALAAVQLDTWHHLPQLHLLLAQIYAAKGDTHSESAQLHLYLKAAPNAPDAPDTRSTLAALDSKQAK